MMTEIPAPEIPRRVAELFDEVAKVLEQDDDFAELEALLREIESHSNYWLCDRTTVEDHIKVAREALLSDSHDEGHSNRTSAIAQGFRKLASDQNRKTDQNNLP